MVEYEHSLDTIFGSLSDSTRRDILRRIIVSGAGLSVSSIAEHYKMSLAAIAKHLTVLEKARLVRKTKKGKQQIVTVEPQAITMATEFLESYRQLWESRLDSLEKYLKTTKNRSNQP